MKRNIFLVLGFTSAITVRAQTDWPPTYIIATDTTTKDFSLPDSCLQIMEDPQGEMKFQNVLISDNFQNGGKKGNSEIKAYWLRYRIENKMQKELQLTFWLNKIPFADLFVKSDSSSWQHSRTGILVPWSQRDGLKSLMAIHVNIQAGKSLLVYERHIYDYLIPTPDNISSADISFAPWVVHNQRNHYTTAIVISFILGLALLMVAINLYFFVIVREKEFLFFSLGILFFGIDWMLNLSDIVFKNIPSIKFYASHVLDSAISFTWIYSIRYFLKTFSRFPRWDKVLIAISFTEVLGYWSLEFVPALSPGNFNSLTNTISFILVLAFVLPIFITITLYRRDKDRITRMIIYALLPLCISFGIMALLRFMDSFSFLAENSTVERVLDIVQPVVNAVYPLTIVWVIILFALTLFIRFSMLRRKYAQEKLEREHERSTMIEQQKVELEKQVAERTSELQQSLENLKSTQKQLIQSEKMASLGELTAGIAHEIQNPLNFVNNFSDINKELIEELKIKNEELKIDDADVKNLLNDIEENSEKINHHGKRADAIVKGMLQHSRTSTGQKEPTDINALCDEYLRLAYHGMRAKDKSFNCEMKTEFDSSLPKINVVPQDIGRVILNLINNAFYACAERKNLEGFQNLQGLAPYLPTVTVNTKNLGDKVEISVRDNGNGIPEKIKNKIFQPFFTTKPTGQGTGLGLSLSYDIVKAHGGEIKVESKVDVANPGLSGRGEGTEFIVKLPV